MGRRFFCRRNVVWLLLGLALPLLFWGQRRLDALPLGSHALYLPVVRAAPDDIILHHLEINQAVQTATNAVPLVADRGTVLRIYATVTGDTPLQNVTMRLERLSGGTPVDNVQVSGHVPLSYARGEYGSSTNVHLPASWLTGTVTLRVTVNADTAVADLDPANNVSSLSLDFIDVPPLELVIVPVVYTHTPTGDVLPAPTTESVTDFVRRTLPFSEIDVTWHTPISFAGNLLNDKQELGDVIAGIKQAEGAPFGRLYMGYYADCFPNGGQCFGTYGGHGNRRTRVIVLSQGPDFNGNGDGYIGAHEIGHAFGRDHAPCGNPPDPDTNFPYPNGSIGPTTFGLDTVREVLWPPSTPDLMSYCGQWWPSDYTYSAILQAHLDAN